MKMHEAVEMVGHPGVRLILGCWCEVKGKALQRLIRVCGKYRHFPRLNEKVFGVRVSSVLL